MLELCIGSDHISFVHSSKNTSALSSTNLGSTLTLASRVIHLPLVCSTDDVRVNITSQLY